MSLRLCVPLGLLKTVCKKFEHRISFLHHCFVGELWMNLDGDISPICVNIFPLVCSSSQLSEQFTSLSI